jgi:S-adenosylmethionine synthetase
MRLFSTEQISRYHPDKYADQISDAILTECLKQDPTSHCGIETMVKDNTVVLGGEITSNAVVDYEAIVHRVASKLNYKVDNIINLIGKQSPEINGAVVADENIGAGDQGIMFGYATSETESYLPFGFDLANKIIKIIEKDVEENDVLIGDAKCQVTVDLDNPGTVEEVLVSVCHRDKYNLDEIRAYVRKLLDGVVTPNKWTINPAGTWNVGGATSDCGLTGRKIVCDQYGGYCAVGGGAFSGKDPSKVDRSATYMARKIAVDLVKQYELKWCEVQLAYAIGVAEPVSVNIKNDRGEDYAGIVRNTYDLTPKGIIKALDLLNINYEKLAEGCHFYN